MWIKFAIALIPIIWLIISLGVMRMSAARACIIGLVLTVYWQSLALSCLYRIR